MNVKNWSSIRREPDRQSSDRQFFTRTKYCESFGIQPNPVSFSYSFSFSFSILNLSSFFFRRSIPNQNRQENSCRSATYNYLQVGQSVTLPRCHLSRKAFPAFLVRVFPLPLQSGDTTSHHTWVQPPPGAPQKVSGIPDQASSARACW